MMTVRRKLAVSGILLSLWATGSARGGFRNDPAPENSVFVDAQNGRFSGVLGSARDSADSSQYIGCVVSGTAAGSTDVTGEMTCGATDAANISAGCRSSDPAMMEAVNAINGDSYIYVGATLVNGAWVCNQIIVNNFSSYPPKQP